MNIPTFEELFRAVNLNYRILGITDGIHFRFYVILLLFIPIVFEDLGYLTINMSNENFVTIMGLLPIICYCFLSLLKILIIVINGSKIHELRKSANILYSDIVNNLEKRHIVRRSVVTVKLLTECLCILNLVLVCFYNFSTLVIIPYYYITTEKVVFSLPYSVAVPFSTEAWIPWFIVYIHSISCGFIAVLFMITVDSLYFILCTHICINFNIISNDIRNLNINNTSNIIKCVQYHQLVIRLSEDLDEIFMLPNFFTMLLGSLQICALGMCITAGEWSNIPGYLLFMASVLLQILMMSFFGENILSESTEVSEAAYHCAWPDMDVKQRKLISLILIRSQKPQQLTAYMFSKTSRKCFRKVLSTSWSYFSILRSVYKSEGNRDK